MKSEDNKLERSNLSIGSAYTSDQNGSSKSLIPPTYNLGPPAPSKPKGSKNKETEEEKERRKQAEADIDRVASGIAVEALTEETRKKYRVGDEVKGVRVVKVEKRAEASGKILAGDIIEEVGFEAVTSPKEFEEAMKAAKDLDTPVTILINRGGNFIFYALNV